MTTLDWFKIVKQIAATGGPHNPAQAQQLVFALKQVEIALAEGPETDTKEVERLTALVEQKNQQMALMEVEVLSIQEELTTAKKELQKARSKATRLERKLAKQDD
jgi:predicted  nucleic acid-binding Zn-ribbon protein